MKSYKVAFVVISIWLIIDVQVVSAEPTAKTYIFAASHYMFYNTLWFGGIPLDCLCKHFDAIIFHDWNRDTIPTIRDSTKVEWRRNKPPILLLYKDGMTLVGDSSWHGGPDPSQGGYETVGGFPHFDSIFFEKNGFC